MSKHREHLKKLGHDVQTLEKKLEQALRDDRESIQKEGKITTSDKMPVKHSPRNSSVQKVCDQRKIKGQPRASVEVTVKTKCTGKSKKNKSKSIAPVSSALSNLSLDDKLESHRTSEHSHCKSSSKSKGNVVWDNLLKTSETNSMEHAHAVAITEEDEVTAKASKVQCDEVSKEKVGELNSCPNCKNIIYGRTYSAHPCNGGGGKVAATSTISSLCCETGMKNSNLGAYVPNELSSEVEHKGLLESKHDSQIKPIETLRILLHELNEKLSVGDESMRKLTGEMQLTLGNLAETMSAAGFNSAHSPSLVGKLSSRGISEQSYKLTKGNETKGSYIDRKAVSIPKNQKQQIIYEKNFEMPVKLADDKEIQVNLSLNSDEKLKLDIEYLKKQLDVQLKSVDRVTAKESEYHTLLVSLLDKVKNLEDEVMEQRKGTNHFLLQNNVLKEQNGVIPTLQASQDLLQKRLQQSIQDYEKLKIDYHLLKLEKEKYCALNDAKDKEIKWFQEEIRNIQHLVEQQMINIRNVDKLETTGNKAEALINLIDSQANLIKSKLGLSKLEASTSYPSIASQSITSCEVLSPKSVSKIPDSVPSPGLDLGKHSMDNPFNYYSLNVPELQSPNAS